MSSKTDEDIEKEQRAYWNKAAPIWGKWQSVHSEILKPAGEALLFEARLRPTYRVLDLATGAGEPGLTAARHVKKGSVVGVDLSEAMIELANAQAEAEGLANYSARVANVTALPFASNEFDAVLCRMGVMFFPNPREALAEMIRVTKPGGRVALAVWTLPKRNPWVFYIASTVNQLLGITPPRHDEPGIFRFADPSELLDWSNDLGLVDVIRREVVGETPFKSAEHYWEAMGELAFSLHEVVQALPETKQKEVRAAVIEAVSDVFRGGSAHMGTSAWLVAGTKAE
jgi:SAM-dependent methyltransferase